MKDDLFKVGYWGWHPDRSNTIGQDEVTGDG